MIIGKQEINEVLVFLLDHTGVLPVERVHMNPMRQTAANRLLWSHFQLLALMLLILLGTSLIAYGKEKPAPPLSSFQEVGAYIKANQRLPDHFITKKEARKRGWEPDRGNLWDVAPGKSIGGDVFHNREKKVPHKKGRIWYEADINYRGGKRTPCRIVFSSDGLIYKTEDHYRTFTRMD